MQQPKADLILKQWASALKMRSWLLEKKANLTQEDSSPLADEEEVFAEKLKQIVTKIQHKAEFLVKLQTPTVNNSESQEDLLSTALITKPSYFVTKIGSSKAGQNEWAEDLNKWRSDMVQENKIVSNEEKLKSLREAGNTSVLACLQSSIQLSQIKNQVEFNI